ncbi:hypothetical protein K461DRAFT_19700 [Myriangium duriaei CBS 260.36]|uniref:Uncharacterized protein n=1 Tax=Myriangium duriaei CBS 260.36 TaxID=1168546 RepID=A0A9P4MPR5_9PEZI|nr:hypothetical protein K461DRAFT_19700 [Myriangium duriaei CBS 260.36]
MPNSPPLAPQVMKLHDSHVQEYDAVMKLYKDNKTPDFIAAAQSVLNYDRPLIYRVKVHVFLALTVSDEVQSKEHQRDAEELFIETEHQWASSFDPAVIAWLGHLQGLLVALHPLHDQPLEIRTRSQGTAEETGDTVPLLGRETRAKIAAVPVPVDRTLSKQERIRSLEDKVQHLEQLVGCLIQHLHLDREAVNRMESRVNRLSADMIAQNAHIARQNARPAVIEKDQKE